MIILSYGQIVAEGTLWELQKKFIQTTSFEIVTKSRKIILQRLIREIDPECELLHDDPVEITGKRRFTFSCTKGQNKVETILKRLLSHKNFEISEFQICRARS